MSVVGFDFGNDSCIISCCRKGVVDVLQNEIGNRKTRSLAVFTDSMRYLGDQGTSQMMSNYKNSLTMFKRLLGVQADAEEIKSTLGMLPFAVVTMPDGGVGVKVQYKGEKHDFSMEQVCAMMFTKLKQTAENSMQKPVSDCVISVPTNWCQDKRRRLLASAKVAGLKVLKLMNETTAVALTYGLLRPLPKDESIKVLFLDVGASKTSCACVEFKAGQLEVLATKTITNCGGWYFDQVLAVAMAADIQKRYKLDIMSNAKARMKLFKEAERVKKNLSANSVVNWGVEYIMDGTDVSGKMSRADFEALITPAVDKIFPAVTDVLEKCALKAEELHSIEVVGGASRIPIVQARLRELLGRDLSKTCDSDEAVARGCALQCAMLSHLVQVLPFALKDRTEFDISVSYVDGAQSSGMDVQMEDAGVAFKAGELIPREAIIEIPSSYSSFEVVAYYTDPSQLPPNTPTNLGRFVVSDVPAQKEGDDRTYKTKVTFRLDGSDMLSVDSVSYLEEIVEAPNSSAAADTVPAENGDKKDAKKEESTDAQEPVAKKTKFSRTELACTSDFPTVTPKQQQEYFDREIKMINNDRVVRETSDMRNELESYVLEMRTKLRSESDLQPYCTEEEAASLIARMDKEEAWLDDEGYDVQKSEYKTHLGDLFALCGPALARARQHQKRDPAIKSLKQVINFYSRWAQDEAANDEKFAHIAQDELNKVLACCQEADQWLLSQQLLQDKLVLHQDPVLTVEALDTRRKSVDKFSNGIRNTPKPKPPKPAPAEEKKPADKAAPAADNSSAEAEVPPAATEEAAPAADNSNAEAPAADAADAAPADNSNTKMDVDE